MEAVCSMSRFRMAPALSSVCPSTRQNSDGLEHANGSAPGCRGLGANPNRCHYRRCGLIKCDQNWIRADTELKRERMASKATVYVVDDDAGVRDALSLLLTLHGYSVRSFAAGQLFLDSIDADTHGFV